MTLGEFRKITEQYDDDCVLLLNQGMMPGRVSQLQITVDAVTADDQAPQPRITIL